MESPDFKETGLTWADVKNLANTLTDEQLKQRVSWWGESRGGFIDNLEVLPENYYQGDEYAFPESEAHHEIEEGTTLEDHAIAHHKGTVMFTIESL